MHVKWKPLRPLYRAEFEQFGSARDALLVQSVRVSGKVRHKSIAHLGTLTKWDKAAHMSEALEKRARQVFDAEDTADGEVRFKPREGRSSFHAFCVAGAALDRMDARDNAECALFDSSGYGDSGFIFKAALQIYCHAPAGEHARLIGKLEEVVSKFVGREVRAPGIKNERVQKSLRWLRMTPEEREEAHAGLDARIAETTEKIKRLQGR
jgi:hypothetical protein